MLFTFPSRYCALSVIRSYLALEGGPPVFGQDFTCPVLLSDGRPVRGRYRAVTCCGWAFHPDSLAFPGTEPVWAPPLSLTTTQGISVDFFSSGYLDVSVPRVCLLGPMYSARGYACAWVSPFGIVVVKDPLRLVPHFRGLARPSSPADAKASPACILSLRFLFPTIQLNLLCMSSSNPHRGASNFSRSIAYSWFSSAVMSICRNRLADALAPGGATGAKETRTPNIQLAKLALYQLSYNP